MRDKDPNLFTAEGIRRNISTIDFRLLSSNDFWESIHHRRCCWNHNKMWVDATMMMIMMKRQEKGLKLFPRIFEEIVWYFTLSKSEMKSLIYISLALCVTSDFWSWHKKITVVCVKIPSMEFIFTIFKKFLSHLKSCQNL